MQNAVGLVGREWVANKAGGFVDDDEALALEEHRDGRSVDGARRRRRWKVDID